jgi:RimJ/RimL family protein N-acetyltransferase
MVSAARLEPIEGPNLVLRLIRPDDAEYVYSLRTDPTYNRHLSQVTGTAEDQRDWIIRYKEREAELQELYYVIERKDGVQCGLVRLYDISSESFTWGSWILDHNKPFKAALESAVLIYVIGFELLEIPKAVFDVRQDNAHTISFHERFKAVRTGENDQDVFFEYPKEQFFSDKARYLSLIEGNRAQ